jgi:hypothetical protein
LLLKITKRCFSKLIVAVLFDSTNKEVSEVERTGMTSLLQLLESVYKKNIWENLGVVVFHNKNIGKD